MNRVNSIVKIIKNVYYVSIYYEHIINHRKVNFEVVNNIDKLIQNKLDPKKIIESIHLGFIELITNIISTLFAELNQKQVDQFKFLCCAYVDEFMYNYIGESQWNKYLMELYFFGTKISGEKVIYDIVEFMEHHSQQDNEYSIVYYYVLCSGYLGIYRQDIVKIHTIKKELLKIIGKEVLFQNYDNLDAIAPNLNASIIKTKQMDNIKNYYQIYARVLLLSLLTLMIIISIVIYKGMIILEIFQYAK